MTLDSTWISEACEDTGSAFSLKSTTKLHEEKSDFQQIAVYRTTHWGNLMLIDGCTMVSSRENFLYHEMMTHPVLFTHPSPRRVAVVGGGDCGTLREVLKHPEVERATQVDIDERVTRVAEEYFPELCEANGDPRAELLFADGIEWVNEASPASLEIIVVDSTDPAGPGEVLFTVDFYAACRRALRRRVADPTKRIATGACRHPGRHVPGHVSRRFRRPANPVFSAAHLSNRLVVGNSGV